MKVTSFFLGTDTAPHMINDKESECGCAGIFNSTYCLPILAQIFDNENSIKNLENFVSKNGAKHYNLPLNRERIKIRKLNKKVIFKKYLDLGYDKIKIFEPDFPIFWEVQTS